MSAPNANRLPVGQALTRFHDRHAGGSTVVFGHARRPDGRSSYAWLADQVSGGRVLDLCCGDGPLAELLVARGTEVIGLDRNVSELACARDRVPGVSFVEGDAHDLPFESGSFDAVLSHMALMLIPDGDRVAAEMARVLRHGGMFAGVVGDGPDRTNPVTASVMPGLHRVLDERGTPVDYPSERWTQDDLERRLPGWAVSVEAMTVSQAVPLEDFAHFVTLSYYGVGLLEGEDLEAAQNAAMELAAPHAECGAVRWSTRMRGFSARHPA